MLILVIENVMLVMLLMCLLLLLLSLLLISWLLLVWWQRVPLSLEPASGFEVCCQECPRFGERSTDRVNQHLRGAMGVVTT